MVSDANRIAFTGKTNFWTIEFWPYLVSSYDLGLWPFDFKI